MSYIPESYLQAKAALNRISDEVATTIEAYESRIADLSVYSNNLNNLSAPAPLGWQELVAYINQEATNSPADEAWQDLKREKDKLVADFQAAKTHLDNIIAAINAV